MYRTNPLKARLAAGESLFGAWLGTASATNAEIMGHIGFDFLLIDQEHGGGGIDEAVACMRAAELAGTPCMVRAPWNDPVWLKRILDAGAQSLMIPSVGSAAEAAAAVRACRYPPQGQRGYAAGVVRASNYGTVKNYVQQANDNLLIVVQIESGAAAEKAAEIAAVDGVDVVFIGVNDLAGSLGLLEQTGHPQVCAAVRQIEEAVLPSGKPLGTVPNGGASTEQLFDRGYRMVVGPHDVALLRNAAAEALQEYRQYRGAQADGARRSTSY